MIIFSLHSMMKAEMIMPFVNAYGLIGLPTN